MSKELVKELMSGISEEDMDANVRGVESTLYALVERAEGKTKEEKVKLYNDKAIETLKVIQASSSLLIGCLALADDNRDEEKLDSMRNKIIREGVTNFTDDLSTLLSVVPVDEDEFIEYTERAFKEQLEEGNMIFDILSKIVGLEPENDK